MKIPLGEDDLRATAYRVDPEPRPDEAAVDAAARRFAHLHDLAELYHENSKLTRATSLRWAADRARFARFYPTALVNGTKPRHAAAPLLDLRVARSGRPARLAALLATALADLHSEACELYVVAGPRSGLPPGVYHCEAGRPALRRLRADPACLRRLRKLVPRGARLRPPTGTHAAFVVVGSFWRVRSRDGLRGYRHVLVEAGTVAQSIRTLSPSAGIETRLGFDFLDDEVHDLLGLDGVDEAALVVAWAAPGPRAPARRSLP